MNPYQSDTLYIIKQLSNENLDIAEKEDGAVVLSVSEEDFLKILPMEHELVGDVILRPMLSDETLKDLAKRFGVDKSLISHVTRKDPKRPVPRPLALRSIFMTNSLPTVAEVDHLLMQLSLPGLYISTHKIEVNRRNWLLWQILELSQKFPCPGDNWLPYADVVTAAFYYEPVSKEGANIPCPDFLKTKIEQWRSEIQAVTLQDFRPLRHSFLARYMAGKGLNYETDKFRAYQLLSDAAPLSTDRIRSLFGVATNANSVGAWNALIELAIALGCTLTETNAMLVQADRALLYPNRSKLEELDWARKLCRNHPGNL